MVKPNDEFDMFDLWDNGVNSDTTQDDGVYSRYYTGATQPGRYTVKCQVSSNNTNTAFEKLGFIGSASPQLFGNQFISKSSLDLYSHYENVVQFIVYLILQVTSGKLKKIKEFRCQILHESLPVALSK